MRCRCINRIFLQAYVPRLQTVGRVCKFLPLAAKVQNSIFGSVWSDRRGLRHAIHQFGGHSLRAGLATSAAAGKSERAIMHQAGHRSVTTVRRYIRDGNLFRENAVHKIGL
jgi:integrase